MLSSIDDTTQAFVTSADKINPNLASLDGRKCQIKSKNTPSIPRKQPLGGGGQTCLISPSKIKLEPWDNAHSKESVVLSNVDVNSNEQNVQLQKGAADPYTAS